MTPRARRTPWRRGPGSRTRSGDDRPEGANFAVASSVADAVSAVPVR